MQRVLIYSVVFPWLESWTVGLARGAELVAAGKSSPAHLLLTSSQGLGGLRRLGRKATHLQTHLSGCPFHLVGLRLQTGRPLPSVAYTLVLIGLHWI